MSDGSFFLHVTAISFIELSWQASAGGGIMPIVRSHIESLQRWEMTEHARKSMNGF